MSKCCIEEMKLSIIKGKEFTTIGLHDDHNQVMPEKILVLKY